jgi:integrase
VLSDAELRLVWHASDHVGWPFAPLAKLLILTGQRRDDVARMRRSELDLDAKTWTIPAERFKNKKAHDVPLSDLAVAIIEKLPRVKGKADFVLTTTGDTAISGYSRAKKRLDKAILKIMREERGDDAKALPEWVLHDLRRTLATGMQRLGVRLEVTEAVLGHVSGSRSGIVGVYQRHEYKEEKRTALDKWAHHVHAVISGKADNVVQLRKQSV